MSGGILSELPHEDTLLTAVLTPVGWMTLFPINSTTQQTILIEGFITHALCICTFTGAQSHAGTGLSWNMVCTLCMTPILHLYDLIVGKTADIYRCGFGPSFCGGRKVVVNFGPYPKYHSLLPRAAKWKVKRCGGLLEGCAQRWISCCLNVILPKKEPVCLAGEPVTVL